jgi:hypothetical protein
MAGAAAGLGALLRRGALTAGAAVRSPPVATAFGRVGARSEVVAYSAAWPARGVRSSAAVLAAPAKKSAPPSAAARAAAAPTEGAELLAEIPRGWLPDSSVKHEEGVLGWTPTGSGGYPADWAEVNTTEWVKGKQVRE